MALRGTSWFRACFEHYTRWRPRATIRTSPRGTEPPAAIEPCFLRTDVAPGALVVDLMRVLDYRESGSERPLGVPLNLAVELVVPLSDRREGSAVGRAILLDLPRSR